MPDREYKRLTRSRPRSVYGMAIFGIVGIIASSRSSLWLGKDHLLCIDTTGYTETYKRFYYRDIQAFFIRKTPSWLVLALLLGAVGIFFGLIALFGGDPIVAWIFGSLAGVFWLGVLLDLAFGPSSSCHLRTAVQTEELVSLTRVRAARKALRRLEPLIAEAQGQLDPAELPVRYREWLTAEPGATSTGVAPVASDASPELVELAPPASEQPDNPPSVAP